MRRSARANSRSMAPGCILLHAPSLGRCVMCSELLSASTEAPLIARDEHPPRPPGRAGKLAPARSGSARRDRERWDCDFPRRSSLDPLFLWSSSSSRRAPNAVMTCSGVAARAWPASAAASLLSFPRQARDGRRCQVHHGVRHGARLFKRPQVIPRVRTAHEIRAVSVASKRGSPVPASRTAK